MTGNHAYFILCGIFEGPKQTRASPRSVSFRDVIQIFNSHSRPSHIAVAPRVGWATAMTHAVFSWEMFTTVTAYRGFVPKSQLLETLLTQNLTKVGRMQRAVWGFLGKQVLRCCTETNENYNFSDSNAERRSLSICRRWCRPKPSLNVKLCRWIVARKFWYLAESLPEKLLKWHLPWSTGYILNVYRFYSGPHWQFLFFSMYM